MTKRNLRIAVAAATAALAFGAGAANAQTAYGQSTTSGQTTQDRLGALAGALFGDRLGLSQMDQLWLRGGRPLADGQAQFNASVDTSLRSGQISTSASTRLKSDYDALIRQESTYGQDGSFSTQERADLTTRYNGLNQTLTSGASGYGDSAPTVAQGRAEFETRVDASVNARRITRTTATQLKSDYQSLIQTESGYLQDGTISAQERADLDARGDALDARVGDGPQGTTPTTPTPAVPLDNRTRLSNLDASVTASERSGAISRAEAGDVRVELGDLVRLEAAYTRLNPSSDDTAYLTRRLGELEARVKR